MQITYTTFWYFGVCLGNSEEEWAVVIILFECSSLPSYPLSFYAKESAKHLCVLCKYGAYNIGFHMSKYVKTTQVPQLC